MTDQLLAPEPREPKERRHALGRVLVGLAVAALMLLAFYYGTRAGDLSTEVDVKETEKQHAEQQAQTAEQKLNAALDRVLTLCQAGGAQTERLHSIGLCDQAAKEKADPAAPAPAVSFRLVYEVVDAYLRANPVVPTPEQLLPLVQRVYRDNPPADGRTPSDGELLTLIRQVYAATPPRDGQDGRDGAPCDPAVKPECQGPPGQDGAQGVQGPGPADVDLQPRGDRCFLVVTWQSYADGTPIPPAEVEINPQICDRGSGQTTTTPPPPLLPPS